MFGDGDEDHAKKERSATIAGGVFAIGEFI
jgi:hypothetical protein